MMLYAFFLTVSLIFLNLLFASTVIVRNSAQLQKAVHGCNQACSIQLAPTTIVLNQTIQISGDIEIEIYSVDRFSAILTSFVLMFDVTNSATLYLRDMTMEMRSTADRLQNGGAVSVQQSSFSMLNIIVKSSKYLYFHICFSFYSQTSR